MNTLDMVTQSLLNELTRKMLMDSRQAVYNGLPNGVLLFAYYKDPAELIKIAEDQVNADGHVVAVLTREGKDALADFARDHLRNKIEHFDKGTLIMGPLAC